jgi:hypothetical protein
VSKRAKTEADPFGMTTKNKQQQLQRQKQKQKQRQKQDTAANKQEV